MNYTAQNLIDLIARSPSCYHGVSNIAGELMENGFEELNEAFPWKLVPGRKYYVRRNQSTLIAFKLPAGELRGYQIAAAHCDSPTFRVKENMELVVDGSYTQLNVEKYGGVLCSSWFDRPLSVAGRILVRRGSKIQSRLVNVDRDLLMIPNLAIHMNREVNEGYHYRIQKDMLPLLGEGAEKGRFMDLVAEAADVKREEIFGSDLFLYCRQKGVVWGAKEEYISAPKLDDLQCAYALMKGFLQAGHPDTVSVYCLFDNEEVGSTTKQGAASTMLADTLTRISSSYNKSREDYFAALTSSFMLSADNAHAVHPSHLDVADPTHHPHMNQGVVIKFSANQKYATDGISSAIFREICRRTEVPTQVFHNHSDTVGGSTLGNLSNTHVPLNTVDIGLAQLAMHSCYETAGALDTDYLIRAAEEFYNTYVENNGWQGYILHRADRSESI